jgi:hypothetical protein
MKYVRSVINESFRVNEGNRRRRQILSGAGVSPACLRRCAPMGVLGVDLAVASDVVFHGGAILRVVGTLWWIRRDFFHACKGWFRAVYRGRRRVHTQRGGGSWGF